MILFFVYNTIFVFAQQVGKYFTCQDGDTATPICRSGGQRYEYCYDSDQNIKCLGQPDFTTCYAENCCDRDTNVVIQITPGYKFQYEIQAATYQDGESKILEQLFNFEGNQLEKGCIKSGKFTLEIGADDADAKFTSRVATAITDDFKGGFQATLNPNDGLWKYSQVYINLKNVPLGTTMKSDYFEVKQVCGSQTIFVDVQQADITKAASALEMKLDFLKGTLICPQKDSQTWSISNPNNLFDMASLTQNDTHLSISVAKPWRSQDPVDVQVSVEDDGNTYTQTPFKIQIACDSSSTSYTLRPDSTDLSIGFPYKQEHQIKPSISEFYYVFKDPINSLAEVHPDTDCVIQSREPFYIYGNPVPDFDAPVLLADGTYQFKITTSTQKKKDRYFKFKLTDKGGQVIWTDTLQYRQICVENYSNIVTSGPYTDATYEMILSTGFQHEIPGFTQNGAIGCLIIDYEITDLTTQVFDNADTLIGTVEETVNVSSSTNKLMIQFPNHIDVKRIHTFKITGKREGQTFHTSQEIRVTSINIIDVVQLTNATYKAVTGAIVQSFPVSTFHINNPNVVASYDIQLFTSEILHEDGSSLGLASDSSYTVSVSGTNLVLTIPSHCDFARSYTFKIRLTTANSLSAQTEMINILSYNNQTLSNLTSLQIPQFSTGNQLDISQIFLISSTGCKVQKLQLSDIWNTETKSWIAATGMLQIEAATNVLKVMDTQNSYQQLDVYVQATFSQDLIFSFDKKQVLKLEILGEIKEIEDDVAQNGVVIPESKPVFIVNIAPQFDLPLEDFYFEVFNTSDQVEFILPGIFDEDPSSVSVDIQNGLDSSFMSFADGKFLFDRFSQESHGNHTLELRLTDSASNFNDYKWTVGIKYLVESLEEDQEINEDEEDQDINEVREEMIQNGKEISDKKSATFYNQWVQDGDEDIDQDSEERDPIRITVGKFDANGELTLDFSEELFPITKYGLNLMQLNASVTNVLSLDYQCKRGESKSTDEKFPELIQYQVSNFTGNNMVLKLLFKNPLYVSSYGQKDTISVTFLANKLFSSVIDSHSLASNYTINKIEVPSQSASQEDFDKISNMGSSAQNGMLFTLIIPFLFMIFMSASMHRVWSFYNMLQLSTNMLNFLELSIPANSMIMMDIIKNIVYFSLFSDKYVQDWLEKYIFSKARVLQNIIFGQGSLVTGAIFLGMALVFVAIGLRVKSLRPLAQKVKDKIMWNSFLRGSIQTYLPTALMVFTILQQMQGQKSPEDEEKNFEGRELQELGEELGLTDYLTCAFKFGIIFFLPIFSYFFIKLEQENLNDPQMLIQYQSLYNQLNTNQSSVYKHSCYFMIRRLLLSYFTVFKNGRVVIHIFLSQGSSIFFLRYLLLNKPYESNVLNNFEIMNEIFTFLNGYSLIIYSEYVNNPEVKYQVGWYFVYFFGFIGFTNIILVFYDIILEAFKNTRRQYIKKKWDKYDAMVDKMVRFIIYNENPDIEKKEIQWQVDAYKMIYCYAELEEKVKQFIEGERREESVSESLSFVEENQIEANNDVIETQNVTPESKQISNGFNLDMQSWYKTQKKSTNPILIVEAPVIETSRFQQVILDKEAVDLALENCLINFNLTKRNCKSMQEYMNLEMAYRFVKKQIQDEEKMILQYINQEDPSITIQMLNQDYIKF